MSKQKLLRLALTFCIMLSLQSYLLAQGQMITGKVTDGQSGEPLVGASILIQGTGKGTITDLDGKYKLVVPKEAESLVFSYIGYLPQTIAVEGRSVVDISMKPDVSALKEVVVVGYGTQTKETLTGAVSQISGEEIRRAPTMNISNALAGRLPGLVATQPSGRPGADNATLRIRGISTTNSAAAAPLVIVDGIERELFNLDPNEIETISILKDASAAVYGVKAANGVILVTTKKGKVGKPVFTYNGSVAINSNTRFPKFLNGPDYMYWLKRGEEMDNEYLIATGKDPIPLTYTDEEIESLRNGTNESEFFGNTDWVGNLVDNTSKTQHHNLTVRGGTENVKYFTSLGYLNQNGVVENTNFTRYNFRTNLDIQFNDFLSSNLNLGGRLEERNNPGVVADNASWMNPFYQAVRILPNLPTFAPNGLPTASRSGGGYVNPDASVANSGYQTSEKGVFQTNLSFNLKVPQIEGLNFRLLTGYDRAITETKNWLSPYKLMARERSSTGWYWVETNAPTASTTSLSQGMNTFTREMFQPSINYDREFGDHAVNVLMLYEFTRDSQKRFTAGGRNFPVADIQELNFKGTSTEDFISPSGESRSITQSGYVSRLRYGYQNKYLAEFASRYDGSSNFAESERWGFFPSVSAGWVVSSEGFMKDLQIPVSFLKVKGSWGKLGNQQTNYFQFMNTFALTEDPVVVMGGKAVPALYTYNLANPNLTWETATVTNIGLESSFWNGLLDVDAEWFYKVTRDILQGQGGIYPPSLGGYYFSTVNSGVVENKGIDMRIAHRNAISKFQYGVTANFNYARNKILEIDDPNNIPEWQRRVGRRIGEKRGFISEGLFQSWEEVNAWPSSPSGAAAPGFIKYRDLNGDGQINSQDITFIGLSNVPEVMYGLNLDMKYGPFDFSALFQGATRASVALGGAYEGSSGVAYGINDNTPFTRTFYNLGNTPYYLVENSWTPENPDAMYPRLQANRSAAPNHNGWANSQFVVDASYLRLKSIQLGYTINPGFLQKLKVESWRFYISGANIFTLDKLKYLDPEMPNVTNGFYPQQRIVSFGTNLSF